MPAQKLALGLGAQHQGRMIITTSIILVLLSCSSGYSGPYVSCLLNIIPSSRLILMNEKEDDKEMVRLIQQQHHYPPHQHRRHVFHRCKKMLIIVVAIGPSCSVAVGKRRPTKTTTVAIQKTTATTLPVRVISKDETTQ